MTIGTVKFFNETKGFGFICSDDVSDDGFVHNADAENSTNGRPGTGQRLRFTVRDDTRSPKAMEFSLALTARQDQR